MRTRLPDPYDWNEEHTYGSNEGLRLFLMPEEPMPTVHYVRELPTRCCSTDPEPQHMPLVTDTSWTCDRCGAIYKLSVCL